MYIKNFVVLVLASFTLQALACGPVPVPGESVKDDGRFEAAFRKERITLDSAQIWRKPDNDYITVSVKVLLYGGIDRMECLREIPFFKGSKKNDDLVSYVIEAAKQCFPPL
jgi:hypothetical protein